MGWYSSIFYGFSDFGMNTKKEEFAPFNHPI